MPPSGGPRKGAGRKTEIKADRNLNIRVDQATLRKLARLEKRWKCSKSEAVRRAISEA